jgi:hypothetical protein
MTYLNWGCDPLEEECESCLDALCNVCNEEFKKKHRSNGIPGGTGEMDPDAFEPDCDDCDREKKPGCSRCEIILAVCSNCSENKSCEFKICGPG